MIARILADLNTIQQDDPHTHNHVQNANLNLTTPSESKSGGKNPNAGTKRKPTGQNSTRKGKTAKRCKTEAPVNVLKGEPVGQSSCVGNKKPHPAASATRQQQQQIVPTSESSSNSVVAINNCNTRHVCSYPGCDKVYGEYNRHVLMIIHDLIIN